MTGTEKVDMCIIGKSVTPRAFKNKIHRLPLKYMAQKNSWMDSATFKRWVQEVFEPYTTAAHGDKPILLIVDNAPGKFLS